MERKRKIYFIIIFLTTVFASSLMKINADIEPGGGTCCFEDGSFCVYEPHVVLNHYFKSSGRCSP
ncbi:MAG: hypothetical protein K9J25_00050 [Bacteroidales bacterium]|nr:hypothetical protein [Bacteroidales bacterium]